MVEDLGARKDAGKDVEKKEKTKEDIKKYYLIKQQYTDEFLKRREKFLMYLTAVCSCDLNLSGHLPHPSRTLS